MIDNFVKISLKDNSGDAKMSLLAKTYKYLSLSYPCKNNSNVCSPYVVDLNKGVYRFECWGAAGANWGGNAKSGKGGYTAGTIYINESTQFFVYVGATGYFNAIKEKYENEYAVAPGGATDVRLLTATDWWEQSSLASRIMVAGGGGSAEWNEAIGGNGGNLEGGTSYYENWYSCKGANQTSGSSCEPVNEDGIPTSGTFGSGGLGDYKLIDNNVKDYGGYGGGGYYGGTSFKYTYAGSGGSSFISGYKGCNAVKDVNDTSPSNSPIHYSGYIFYEAKMIQGNNTMPLPIQNDGIHEGQGAFRITLLLFYQQCTFKQNLCHISALILPFIYRSQ